MSSPIKIFKTFTCMTYAEQGKAFLNAYWGDQQDKAENTWNVVHKFIELDLNKGEEGCDLDEFNAHRVLEHFGETKTVKAMREELLAADLDFNKRLAVIEYCLWSAGKTVEDFVKRPQGEGEAVKKAQAMFNEVMEALSVSKAKAEVAKTKLEESKAAAAEAKQKEAEAATRAVEAKRDEEEQKAALAEVKQLEDAYNKKTETLKAKTETGGVVTRNKAKAELAQHLAEDPLPLRQAKITCEASTRKAEKSRLAAEAAHAEAVKSREEAEEAAEAASKAKAEADAAVEDMLAKVAEAEALLEEAKRVPSGQGNVWWVERQLTEAKKYMPLSKGGIARK